MSLASRELHIQCLKYLLRPIMRFCLRHSLKIQEIIAIAKSELLAAAEEEIIRRRELPSVSKLSIMTGLHRPDVSQLQREGNKRPATENLISRVIGQWQYDRRFLDSRKSPRVLRVEGKESEFAELVSSLSDAVNPYTVLAELVRVGAVERTASGAKLLMQAHITSGDMEGTCRIVGNSMHDLFMTVEENMRQSVQPPNLHLVTEYDSISVPKLPAVRKWFFEAGSAFHRRAREFLSKYDKDINRRLADRGPLARVTLSSFSRIEAPEQSDNE